MQPDSMDAVFAALASATRRAILDVVRATPGCNVNAVCAGFATSRIAVMKHLRVLEDALLLHSKKEGRERRLYFNAVPIQLIYDRWTNEYSGYWSGLMADVKYKVEMAGRKGAAKGRVRKPGRASGKRKR